MFNHRHTLVLALVTVATGCDATMFAASIDVPEVCISGMNVQFAPSASGAVIEDTIAAEDLGILGSEQLDLDVELLAVGLTPADGIDDLEFVDVVAVNMASANESMNLPRLEVLEMTAADHLADGAMYNEPENAVDISTYIRGGEVVFSLDITGDLPTVPWQASMDLCMHANGTYEPL